MSRIFSALFFTCMSLFMGAQNAGPDMADAMRENGKIYVVIGVIAVIFVSIAVFLVFIERRLARLEKTLGSAKTSEEKK